MSGPGHLRWERSYADADSNKLLHSGERCVEPASWHKHRQGERCLVGRPRHNVSTPVFVGMIAATSILLIPMLCVLR